MLFQSVVTKHNNISLAGILAAMSSLLPSSQSSSAWWWCRLSRQHGLCRSTPVSWQPSTEPTDKTQHSKKDNVSRRRDGESVSRTRGRPWYFLVTDTQRRRRWQPKYGHVLGVSVCVCVRAVCSHGIKWGSVVGGWNGSRCPKGKEEYIRRDGLVEAREVRRFILDERRCARNNFAFKFRLLASSIGWIRILKIQPAILLRAPKNKTEERERFPPFFFTIKNGQRKWIV